MLVRAVTVLVDGFGGGSRGAVLSLTMVLQVGGRRSQRELWRSVTLGRSCGQVAGTFWLDVSSFVIVTLRRSCGQVPGIFWLVMSGFVIVSVFHVVLLVVDVYLTHV